jgi:putrescine aminotransferase
MSTKPNTREIGLGDPLQQVRDCYRLHVNQSLARLGAFMGTGAETRAEGAYVYDQQGRRFLDCGGFGTLLLGHRHPAVVSAVEEQLRRQPLPTRLMMSPVLAAAAERLAARAPNGLEYVYLTTSGAEAVELALKLGRLGGRRRLIAMDGAFHGKTLAALALCGDARLRERLAPAVLDVEHVGFGDASALEDALGRTETPATVFLEPIQGEGGVRIPPGGYLKAVAAACARHDAFLVVDEVQTGLGRTGSWWASEADGIQPDILLAGKALSGGVAPVAALIATPAAFAPLNEDAYLHSSTFGNNPQAAAATLATLEVLENEDVPARARQLGELLLADLREVLDRVTQVREVRGRGLLIGVEFHRPEHAGEFVSELYDNNVLATFGLADQSVVRLTPPVVLSGGDRDWLMSALARSGAAIDSLDAQEVGCA